MKYFGTIMSFADLKRQYRKLAIANHPDKGGSTQAMQEINAEFETLYRIWEKRRDEEPKAGNGYENDYNGATAREYTSHVYNEYRWQSKNYKGQRPSEIAELFRQWAKETYPDYKFSVRVQHYNSITIRLLIADFAAFRESSGIICNYNVNHYYIERNGNLTDRAKEVMQNVTDYIMSYNYDDSDLMTDYFNTNFYLSLYIGSGTHPYKIVIPKSRRTGGQTVPVFKRPEGPGHKVIRLALGKNVFGRYDTVRHGELKLLGSFSYSGSGVENFWPLSYSSAATAIKRIVKLDAAGIETRLTGFNSGYIQFIRYKPQTEALLEAEDRQADEAEQLWNEKHQSA